MIRVLIADDHPVVREGLRRILAACDDIDLVAEVDHADQVLEQCSATSPDVVVLDIGMPGPGFLETLRRVRSEHPQTRVLILSMHDPANYAVRSLRAGAAGYLSKDRSPSELAEAIRRVREGRRYLTEDVAEQIASALQDGPARAPHELLSHREYQVFLMLAEARSVTEIARSLELSPKTVSTHRARILDKMRMRSNAELIRYSLENGLS